MRGLGARGDVYILIAKGQPEGPCKIGVSKNPKKRLKHLQIGSPVLLEFSATFSFLFARDAYVAENSAHIRLEAKRSHGEWFNVSADEAFKVVESICAGETPLEEEPPARTPREVRRDTLLEAQRSGRIERRMM